MMSYESESEHSSEDEVKNYKRKKSKHKKHKNKIKKDKKRKRKRQSSTSSQSSEEEWVTKDQEEGLNIKEVKKGELEVETSVNEKRQREEWMSLETAFPTYSNDSKKAKRREEREKQNKLKSIDRPGQNGMELNPYWKDGGTGLPSEDVHLSKEDIPSSSTTTSAVGDGGLSWLKKSYQRAMEQAQEEGKTLEEVAAIRWGSLENFFLKLEEAEAKAKGMTSSTTSTRRHRHSRNKSSRSPNLFRRPRGESSSDEESSRYTSSHSRRKEETNRRSIQSESRSWQKEGTKKRSPDRKFPKDIMKESLECKRPDFKSRSRSPPYSNKSSDAVDVNTESEIKVANVVEGSRQPVILSDKEMNELGAKMLKAELMGNDSLVAELKGKIAESEKIRQEFIKSGNVPGKEPAQTTKVVTKIIMESGGGRGRRVKDKITETHKDGQRVRYFPDDDKYTLQSMFQREKLNTVEDENALFSRLAGKGAKANSEYDMDDIFADKASSSKSQMKDKEREVRKVIEDDKQYQKTLDDCNWCFDGKHLQKNLVVAIGEKSFLCVPPFQSLTEGHCLIAPMFHSSCSTQLDEDVWLEMKKFRQAVVKMFADSDQDVVIFETAMFLKRLPHMYLECIPMPKETGELAPIYFKKAIQECETEWSQNKKLVDLRNRDVRKAVPKGLPYFSIDFGLDSGFAHVIEDEKEFPRNFAHEIVGGMLELDHHLWRKQKKDDFNTQRDKVMNFLKSWAPYDFTRNGS